MNDHRQEEAERLQRDEGDLRVALALLYSNSNWNAVIYFAGLFAGVTSLMKVYGSATDAVAALKS